MKVVIILVSVLAGGLCLPGPHGPQSFSSTLQKMQLHTSVSSDWGANLTIPELIEAFGYPVEVHHVTTEDGYILGLHRIPYGVSGPSSGRPPIFLHHGLLSSSADWVMNTPDKALAYILADAGYDVWLTNVRGNIYSRNHTEISPDDIKFWSFSWDEMAVYDATAGIDYVLETTGESSLYYVGFSMGTTIFFALMSEKPEYNDKVRVMVGLAPVAYLEYAKGPIIEVAQYSNDLETLFTLLGVGELTVSSEAMDYLAENYCEPGMDSAEICYNFIFLICGPDPGELNVEFFPNILEHYPGGSSVHTVIHYGQIIISDNFTKYDYGLIGNLNHYGQANPPLYDLSRITAPVGLFWADNDWLGDPTDVARLAAELPNVVLNYEVELSEFNHLDFVWAIHANEYVYRQVLELLSNY
nr:lipase lipl-1-like [Cherax quadricarinatus]XP_053646080.1 lipase lipl-1-like [Cherax quadricarinatus]